MRSTSPLATQECGTGQRRARRTTTITAGSNDALSLSLDGTAATVTLTAGAYTPAQLAAEIQSKINGARRADRGRQRGNRQPCLRRAFDHLQSLRHRLENREHCGTLAATFGTVDYTNGTGKDVAGTIGGGVQRIGQTLSGSGDADGLSLKVTGGATGDRGNVKFAQGYAAQLDKLIGGILASDGTLTSRTDGINRSIKDIGSRRDALNLRLVTVEKRYRAQYTALDVMMSNMTKTSSFLQQQLANLPGASKK